MECDVGLTPKNLKIVEETYQYVTQVQRELFWLEQYDIQRIYPKLWLSWCDLEDQMDERGNAMSYDGFKTWQTKAFQIWSKIESSCLQEKNEMVANGIEVKPVENPWAISFVQDKRKAVDVCEVGFVTWDELDDYFNKRTTVRELQQKNLQPRQPVEGSQLIGPVGLGNDGTGRRRLKDVIPAPALQKSAQFAPDFGEKCTHMHTLPLPEIVQPEVKPDIIGFELEDDGSDGFLEIGDITEAWDNNADR